MASLSLPRVLQQRKTSLELERENFEKFQSTSISKAINMIESPVKEKHVRSTIIGTFTEKGGATFWACVLRLPLLENRILAWKFCHVLHKVLREGHPQVVPYSQRHKGTIEDVGKLWCHLKADYGKLIQLYCHLLLTKLEFHRRNPHFPGNLQISDDELDKIGEDDVNTYFELSVEMFDYMDEILNLQNAVFGSLDMSRSNSMMSSGQCRLAPLIPCIQDSSQLYDYCVKILFRLHASLPPDTLIGHRERFLKQWRELRQFYMTASTLQYFKTLIHIPLISENPPNFLIQAELRSYIPPVVTLPPEEIPETDAVDGHLIDTSDSGSTGDLVDLTHHNGSVSPDMRALELEDTTQQLMSRMKQEFHIQLHDHKQVIQKLEEKILELETQLATKDSELLQEKQIKDDLLQQTEYMVKFHEIERKAKSFEEKFQKLKEVYTKLREEHIQLIRQKADVDKQLCSAKTASENAARSRALAEAKLQEMLSEKQRTEVALQQSSSESSAEIIALRTSQDAVKSENMVLLSKVDWINNEKSILEGELQDLLGQKEDLDVRLREMEARMESLEVHLHQKSNDKMYQLMVTCVIQAETLIQRSIHEIDNPALSAVICTPDYFQSLTEPLQMSLKDVHVSFENYIADSKNIEDLVKNVITWGHLTSNYLFQGKTTSNKSPDIEFGDRIAEACKSIGNASLILLASLRDKARHEEVYENVCIVESKITEVANMITTLINTLKGDSAEIIEDLLEDELSRMDKAIEEAAKKIEEMLSKSRVADSGLKLEVNEKILDSCTNLMKAIRLLVQKSRLLQAEIVAQGKGTASAKEFYKRNHQWTEGLISAAKAVGVGAKFLLTAADKVVSGSGKFEQLVVASQEIAASTAQLVVASRVKADRKSNNLLELSTASKGVTHATGTVVATAKDCSQMVEESEDLDVSGLTLHQAKRLEMESQVRVLELDQSLQMERMRLAALRRQHYQLAGEIEGWDKDAIEQNV